MNSIIFLGEQVIQVLNSIVTRIHGDISKHCLTTWNWGDFFITLNTGKYVAAMWHTTASVNKEPSSVAGKNIKVDRNGTACKLVKVEQL